jgi:hypothetical protein
MFWSSFIVFSHIAGAGHAIYTKNGRIVGTERSALSVIRQWTLPLPRCPERRLGLVEAIGHAGAAL